MRHSRILLTALSAIAVLAACEKQQPATATTPEASAPAVTEAKAPEATAATSATAVIASQPGYAGSTWELNRAQVTGNILTLQFTVKTTKSLYEYTRFAIDQIALIDDTTSQRYSVLKDDTGRPMVSPLSDTSTTALQVGIGANSSGVVWLKFPAPPATSQSVSITIPEVAPFDGIKISR